MSFRGPHQKMKVQCRNLDRISALPQDVIGKILTLMPIRDALRTSILSRKWRCCWKTMPKVRFDDNMYLQFFPETEEEFPIDKFISAIFHVLLLHKGPILEFVICMADIHIFNTFDQIIVHLSKSNSIKKFIFEIWSPYTRYKLPSLFFSFHELDHLDLTDCAFEPPSVFNGFSMLRKLRLYDVDITATTLLRFLTNCPLLEEFTLIGDQTDFTGENKCTFAQLFECLPSVQVLDISKFYIEQFTAGVMPQKLPTYLVHLRILVLDMCFHELSHALVVIDISPNLEKLRVEMCSTHTDCVPQTFKDSLDLHDCLGLNLDHLKELEITECCIRAPEMAFVKLIMAKSPRLKKARIELDTSVSVDEEFQMLRDLLLLPFPRASPTAKFVIERPKK